MPNKNKNTEVPQCVQTSVVHSADCTHDFRKFYKTVYGRLKVKEVKCIYCDKNK